eukprot:4469522-Pleurochrysis_carterae.AAC.1
MNYLIAKAIATLRRRPTAEALDPLGARPPAHAPVVSAPARAPLVTDPARAVPPPVPPASDGADAAHDAGTITPTPAATSNAAWGPSLSA